MSNSHENQGDWICPNCGPILSVCVTYEETCTHCHCPVFWVDENHVLISKDELFTQAALLDIITIQRDEAWEDLLEARRLFKECRELVRAYHKAIPTPESSALLPKLDAALKEGE